jgi:hypothetical protein
MNESTVTLDDKIWESVHKAMENFWLSVSEDFPECSGDVSPLVAMGFDMDAYHAVCLYVKEGK